MHSFLLCANFFPLRAIRVIRGSLLLIMTKAIDWLKANYDRAVLMAAAVFFSFPPSPFGGAPFSSATVCHSGNSRQTASQPPVAVDLDRAAEQLQKPIQWKASTRSGLFVPEKHFIGADGMPATLENTQVHAPVPNEWFEKYALPIEDADALEEDPDKDGFTNLDEWQGNTDPTKAESHPDYTTKLHLVSATEEPFRYIFASRTKDKFGINSIDETEPTQFLKVGDVIRGTDFKIVKFTEKYDRNQLRNEDERIGVAARTPEQPCAVDAGEGQVATSPQSVATFVYSWGGRKEFEVRKDQEFPLVTAEGNRSTSSSMCAPTRP